jgi:ribosomal protein S18 acetylase RimI-like enzyme
MTIRIATGGDAAGITELAIAFRNHLQRESPSDADFIDSVGRLLGSPDAEFFLVGADGRPVGYVLQRYRHSMWASGTEATIEDLFVDPGSRKGGLGKELIQFAVDRARARGCRTICLDTNENNAASQRIYQGLGFSAFSKRWQGNQVFYRLGLEERATQE